MTRDRKDPVRRIHWSNHPVEMVRVKVGDDRYIEVRAGYGESVRVQNALARRLDQPILIERKQRA